MKPNGSSAPNSASVLNLISWFQRIATMHTQSTNCVRFVSTNCVRFGVIIFLTNLLSTRNQKSKDKLLLRIVTTHYLSEVIKYISNMQAHNLSLETKPYV